MPRNRESELSKLGRLGAHSLHAKYDSKKTSEAGRQAFLRSFEDQVDPDGILDLTERARRAVHLRKAHFIRLALLSVQKRRERRITASDQANGSSCSPGESQ